jgi:hypothetical protein
MPSKIKLREPKSTHSKSTARGTRTKPRSDRAKQPKRGINVSHEPLLIMEKHTMPLAFSSQHNELQDAGCILANGDYYVVFEAQPLTVKEMVLKARRIPSRGSLIRHLYSASVFYQKSQNQNATSHSPIYVFSLVYNIATPVKPKGMWATIFNEPDEPAILRSTIYLRHGEIVRDYIENNFTKSSALQHLMEGVCAHLGVPRKSFRKIGPLSLGRISQP